VFGFFSVFGFTPSSFSVFAFTPMFMV
jgi:hypothetical protein